MHTLVVQENEGLGRIWCRFLSRRGLQAELCCSVDDGLARLRARTADVLVFDPAISGGALALADYATYRNPEVKILAVTGSTFFSDDTIYTLIPNARGVLHPPVRPEDLAAYLEHFSSTTEFRQTDGDARRA